MARDRRRFLQAVSTAGLAAVAGCVGGFGDEETESAATVGMIYSTGGLGDNSFNDMAQQGVMAADEEFGVSYDETEPDTEGDFDSIQRDFAESGEYDLITCVGFQQEDPLADNAPEYPEQNFIIIDAVVEDADNVRSYVFGEHEGSFQVGHLAGLLTTEEFEAGDAATDPDEATVGFVGGIEAPLIRKFEAGFVAGVEHANPDVEVVTSYVGDFNDTAGGRETALSMYQDQGADIVYHAAGATGVGVFQAAESEGRLAIGVDDDQSVSEEDYADVIVASMVKGVDEAVIDAVADVVDDEFSGGVEELGLADDGVGVAYGQSIGDAVPDEIVSALEESEAAIVDGEIDVPEQP